MNNETALTAGLDGASRTAAMDSLWALYSHVAAVYACGDTSLREEEAAALFESVCFTVETELRASGIAPRVFTKAELSAFLDRGRKRLETYTEQSKRLLKAAVAYSPALVSQSYRETLRSIGGFFKRYDVLFFAHLIPCDIDYQLCQPVGDGERGVLFIRRYLRHIVIENDFLRRFSKSALSALYSAKLLVMDASILNLYEPVAENALGCALAGADVMGLSAPAITSRVSPAALTEAAAAVCAELGMTEPASLDYLVKTAEALFPRLEAAADISKIFVSF